MTASTPALRTGLRPALGAGAVALVTVAAWLAVEYRAADLDAAANGVLATSSGANDAQTQARLSQLFAQLDGLASIRLGLGSGAALAVVAAAAIALVLLRRGARPLIPAPQAIKRLTVVGIVLVVVAVLLAGAEIAWVLASRQPVDPTLSGVVTAIVRSPFLGLFAPAVALAGLVALLAAILLPALAGCRAAPRAAGAIGMAVGLLAVDVGLAAVAGLPPSSGIGTGQFIPIDTTTLAVSVANTLLAPVGTAAGLAVIAAVATAALAPSRARHPID